MSLFVQNYASKQSCQVGRDEWIPPLISSRKVTVAFEDQQRSMPFSRDVYRKVQLFFFFAFYVSVVLRCLKQTTSQVCAPSTTKGQEPSGGLSLSCDGRTSEVQCGGEKKNQEMINTEAL